MNSLTNIIFSEVNITLTILVILLLIYWIVSMFSGLDFDLDVDVDIDVDVDLDVDAGIDGGDMDLHDVANAEVNKEDVIGDNYRPRKWWQILLIYFNFVGLPFMFTFTSWIFIWWICTTASTAATESYNNSFGFVLMLGGIIPSLFITKIFTTPFKSFFKNLNQDGDLPIELIGRRGVCLSNIKGDKLGSAEVIAEGNSLSINIKALDGETLSYKDSILIIDQNEDKTFYYVQKI